MNTQRLGFVLVFGLAACDPAATDAPATSPTSTQRPPDKTEVTMEISSAAPPAPPPPPTATPTPAEASADVSDDALIGGKQTPEMEKALAPIRPRIRVCYKKAMNTETSINGTAAFDATVGKDGKVASARLVKREGVSEDMMGCLLAAVKTMAFEGDARSRIVTLSFGRPVRATANAATASVDAGATR